DHRLPFTIGYFGMEELLVQIISKYAAILAIGRPGEPAAPFGALRIYVREDVWQEKLTAIAPLCRFVVCVTGVTKGLGWEMQHLIEKLPPSRLLLLVHVHMVNLTPQQRSSQWAAFLAAYQDVFPRTLPQDVERIQYIAFDDDWNPVPLPASDYRPS